MDTMRHVFVHVLCMPNQERGEQDNFTLVGVGKMNTRPVLSIMLRIYMHNMKNLHIAPTVCILYIFCILISLTYCAYYAYEFTYWLHIFLHIFFCILSILHLESWPPGQLGISRYEILILRYTWYIAVWRFHTEIYWVVLSTSRYGWFHWHSILLHFRVILKCLNMHACLSHHTPSWSGVQTQKIMFWFWLEYTQVIPVYTCIISKVGSAYIWLK